MSRIWRSVSAAGVLASAAALALITTGSVSTGAQTTAPRPAPASRPAVAALTIEPASVPLIGPRAQAHVLVTARFADGSTRDVTAQAAPTLTPASLVRLDRDGTLRPLKDGTATVKFVYGGRTAAAKVTVKGAAQKTPIGFANEIVPILTRAGCNQGSCHGSQYGKGGFKLSLAGFDPDLDYLNIVKQARGRRVALADPQRSLLLLKPTMMVAHGGGRRLEPGSPDYNTLVRWLKDGAPGPKPDDPTVARIEVFPQERILQRGEGAQRLVVRAIYTDGTIRDVTPWARLNTLNDAVAACTPEGVVTRVGQGQTHIMVRYGGQATVARILVPFVPHLATGGPQPLPKRGSDPSAYFDALVARKQKQLGLSPSPVCDDRTFIRRVSFDLIGTAPKPEEIKAFLADKSPDKRAKLVDALLARPEYADYWTLKWSDVLRSNRKTIQVKGIYVYQQ
ncbi:MAG TPA: DUF1549 domain-containing protein, partial [Chthonomonadaceae bacterium]|nr:DUF1549 domain-containing protein [Chthonomonadaceae bacterium]